MSEDRVYDVPGEWKSRAHIDEATYKKMYKQSVEDPDGFWREHGKRIDWIKPYTRVKNASFDYDNVSIKWFEDGALNVCANCVDRHLETKGDQAAIIWEPDDPNEEAAQITYRELHAQVCRLANALKDLGVGKGDRVTVYMPMIPEAAYAMLACARIGAIHSVVFGGFSADALAGRIEDCRSNFVITADEGVRGGKTIPLKANTDEAIKIAAKDGATVDHVMVVKRTGADVPMQEGRDVWYHEATDKASADCPAEEMNAEDPLFILYTSGSTGKPKGVMHTSGGYLVHVSMTHQYVFDYHDGDIYWCTADVGWVTGHSYIVYGPLANGATTLIFEGVPNYPDASRHWQVCDKHNVNIYYTAPTAIRALMGAGDEPVKKTSRKSIRLLGTVGEPINPEAWEWYYNVVGEGRCPVVDTWWQTETGSIMITPLPGIVPTKPGSATLPFPGIDPAILDEAGNEIEGEGGGLLAIRSPWPSMLRGIWRDPERFKEQYWSKWEGIYFTGDGAHRDEEGYYWLLGRVDDVMNVAGHRIGTMEVESALVDHPAVAEAAVVGTPHEIKGTAISAFVTIKESHGKEQEDPGALEKVLKQHVAEKIGAIARPERILFTAELPKTRSGKIMRRLLRDIAEGKALGDVTTLADPAVVQKLKERYEEEG